MHTGSGSIAAAFDRDEPAGSVAAGPPPLAPPPPPSRPPVPPSESPRPAADDDPRESVERPRPTLYAAPPPADSRPPAADSSAPVEPPAADEDSSREDALSLIDAAGSTYRVELELEGGLKISAEIRSLRIVSTEDQ